MEREVGANDARFLVNEASGYSAAEWLDAADVEAPERAETRLRAMTARRVAGEPLQYVLGSWSFRGLDLAIDQRVLIPRPETEWVVEVALEEAQRLGLMRAKRRPALDRPTLAYLADLGTGSGAIALALERELPEAEVWATDVSDDALAVARANVAGCAATRVRLGAGSWFDALPDELRGHLTMIVSNPPYVAASELPDLPPEVAQYEPHTALISGPSGLEALAHLLAEAPGWLTNPGGLVCELAPHQAEAACAQATGFSEVFVRDDLTGRPRVLVARLG
ncbi:MAG: peptide chain release factor N(5)-glutamine methyltransferase [Acidimicrobiia bacterium]